MASTPPSPSPQRSSDNYQGPQPYTIHVPTRYLELTTQKFDTARLPRQVSSAGGEAASADAKNEVDWTGGTPRRMLEKLIDYWQDSYNWRSQETYLNSLPHFRVSVDVPGSGPLRIHFLWHQHNASGSSETRPIPLLLVGEVWEFSKMFPILRDSATPFDVIAPSLPGQGHSDPSSDADFGPAKAADTLHALMEKLGYKCYIAHGSGALGFAILRFLAISHPGAVRGIHFTSARISTRRPLQRLKVSLAPHFPGSYSSSAMTAVRASAALVDAEAAQYRFTSDVLAYAISDSPVALLAWVSERLRREAPGYKWAPGEILTVFMLLWTPGLQGSIMMWAAGEKSGEFALAGREPTDVPMGVSSWDGSVPPKDLVRVLGPVTSYRKRAGATRLCAWEKPLEVVEDLESFCKTVWKADARGT